MNLNYNIMLDILLQKILGNLLKIEHAKAKFKTYAFKQSYVGFYEFICSN